MHPVRDRALQRSKLCLSEPGLIAGLLRGKRTSSGLYGRGKRTSGPVVWSYSRGILAILYPKLIMKFSDSSYSRVPTCAWMLAAAAASAAVGTTVDTGTVLGTGAVTGSDLLVVSSSVVHGEGSAVDPGGWD